MALAESGDFLIPSFHGKTNFCSRFMGTHDHGARAAERDIPLSSSSNTCISSSKRLNQSSKATKIIRNALRSKNIDGNGSLKNSNRDRGFENDDVTSVISSTLSQVEYDEDDEETFRNEIYSNDRVIDSLREKYVCLNFEFNQLQQRHDKNETIQSDSSENALERKYTHVFQRNEIPKEELIKTKTANKRPKSRRREEKTRDDKENIIPNAQENNKELQMILKTLKKIFKTQPVASKDTGELRKLYEIVKTLQEEQEKFRNIIKEQQDKLNDFHTKHLQAQTIIQSQRYEIKQLYSTNAKLENELNANMNALKEQFKHKINELSHFPRAAKTEKSKADKLTKENISLVAKLQQAKQELTLARAKLEELSQKRTQSLSKLKASERDLKIFRTQNNLLRTEKRSLFEELNKLKGLNDDLRTNSFKNISRQKERGETMQRLLRKKIIDLEIELNQSKNSTNVLVEERDKLIEELNMQLNTLVHNFEVSQKHIRILRRHIYSLNGAQNIPLKVT